MLNIKSFVATLPHEPGIYQMLDRAGHVIYIGKARNLKKRVSSYFSAKTKDPKTLALMQHVHDVQITITYNENEALLLECNLIKKHRPHYNVLFRDDKSYPYILITKERPYPSIRMYRGPRKAGGNYFGPYPNSSAVRETIHLLQKLFGLRTSDDRYDKNRTRPCLRYQIGMCSGACAGIISPADYAQDVQHAILFLEGKNKEIIEALSVKMEQASARLQYEKAASLRNQISKLREIQERQYIDASSGDVDVIGMARSGSVCIQLFIIRGGRILGSRSYFPTAPLDATSAEIITSFITQHYLTKAFLTEILPKEIIVSENLPERLWLQNSLSEYTKRAIKLRHNVRGERSRWIAMANHTAELAIAGHLLQKVTVHERFQALQELIKINKKLERIECFDISHTMGEATVASCVVFDRQGPVKSDYRRFNITGITPGDDLAAMHQAILRRYKNLQQADARLPDLLLIDGGLNQVAQAREVLNSLKITEIVVVGVAKGVTRKAGLETLHLPNQPPLHLAGDSGALHLIQQVRDEAHRFAITGHRARRDKARRISSLEEIPGIGAKRRRELLRYFGGIQALNRASLAELAKVPGISLALAKRIFAAKQNGSL